MFIICRYCVFSFQQTHQLPSNFNYSVPRAMGSSIMLIYFVKPILIMMDVLFLFRFIFVFHLQMSLERVAFQLLNYSLIWFHFNSLGMVVNFVHNTRILHTKQWQKWYYYLGSCNIKSRRELTRGQPKAGPVVLEVACCIFVFKNAIFNRTLRIIIA